jgi:hypothetical protein
MGFLKNVSKVFTIKMYKKKDLNALLVPLFSKKKKNEV